MLDDGVDVLAVLLEPVVQVRTRGEAGGANLADQLALSDAVAGPRPPG